MRVLLSSDAKSLDAIGVIVADIDVSVRSTGSSASNFPTTLDPEGHGHVESTLPGGLRLLLDTEESIKSFAPEWSPPTGGPRVGIAFLCESAADVDRVDESWSIPEPRASNRRGMRYGASATRRYRIRMGTRSIYSRPPLTTSCTVGVNTESAAARPFREVCGEPCLARVAKRRFTKPGRAKR